VTRRKIGAIIGARHSKIETLVGLDQLNEVDEQTIEDMKWE
jgi:hypothetical protein